MIMLNKADKYSINIIFSSISDIDLLIYNFNKALANGYSAVKCIYQIKQVKSELLLEVISDEEKDSIIINNRTISIYFDRSELEDFSDMLNEYRNYPQFVIDGFFSKKYLKGRMTFWGIYKSGGF